ncbi:unnamed protein product [Nippostrongylus brasiliensis]|uniref:FLZ-type domain-containing protein n=1 Tax=Nippostrongylus brasiliensis TaxID=27835 RepID=A0A0N4XWJ3_NIPBR|nr:unnamed protein product [Nippostrongylus brasiliensis]
MRKRSPAEEEEVAAVQPDAVPRTKRFSCAEQCAEDFMSMAAAHPDYTTLQRKEESLRCIQHCRDSMTDINANAARP